MKPIYSNNIKNLNNSVKTPQAVLVQKNNIYSENLISVK